MEIWKKYKLKWIARDVWTAALGIIQFVLISVDKTEELFYEFKAKNLYFANVGKQMKLVSSKSDK